MTICLLSYRVWSHFTSISLTETKKAAVELIFRNKPKPNSKNFLNLQPVVLTFLFKDNTYNQFSCVSIESPLPRRHRTSRTSSERLMYIQSTSCVYWVGPILANLFMVYHERNWLNWLHEFDIGEILFLYRRYVDDIFCIFKNVIDADIILST